MSESPATPHRSQRLFVTCKTHLSLAVKVVKAWGLDTSISLKLTIPHCQFYVFTVLRKRTRPRPTSRRRRRTEGARLVPHLPPRPVGTLMVSVVQPAFWTAAMAGLRRPPPSADTPLPDNGASSTHSRGHTPGRWQALHGWQWRLGLRQLRLFTSREPGVVAPLLAEREIYLWWWPR